MKREEANRLYGRGWSQKHAEIYYFCEDPKCEAISMGDCRECLEDRVKQHLSGLIKTEGARP